MRVLPIAALPPPDCNSHSVKFNSAVSPSLTLGLAEEPKAQKMFKEMQECQKNKCQNCCTNIQRRAAASTLYVCLDAISIPSALVCRNEVPLQVAPTCSGAQQVNHREAPDLHTVEELITLRRPRGERK